MSDNESLSMQLQSYPVLSILAYKNWQYQCISLIQCLENIHTHEDDLQDSLKLSKSKSNIDPLTGALNRYGAEEKFQNLVAYYMESQEPFSLIMYDIDFFKKVNDTYGHDIGDEVLIEISSMIQEGIRKDDALFRFGGEEFIVFLANTSLNTGKKRAEAFRKEVKRRQYTAHKLEITASFGVLEYSQDESLQGLIRKVDALLYEAKNSGRDRVISSSDHSTS